MTTCTPEATPILLAAPPPCTGTICVDEKEGRVRLTWHTQRIPDNVNKAFLAHGFQIKGKRRNGGWIFERPWSEFASYEVVGRVDVCCKNIPGLLYVTPNATDYRLRALPFTAAKLGKGRFQVYDNRITTTR